MKRRDFLEKRGLSSLKIKVGWLERKFAARDPDREAALELYIPSCILHRPFGHGLRGRPNPI